MHLPTIYPSAKFLRYKCGICRFLTFKKKYFKTVYYIIDLNMYLAVYEFCTNLIFPTILLEKRQRLLKVIFKFCACAVVHLPVLNVKRLPRVKQNWENKFPIHFKCVLTNPVILRGKHILNFANSWYTDYYVLCIKIPHILTIAVC